ncbi:MULTISPECIES: histidine phosphatase family protein [unclassified Streptomyces]|uniref:histidine phosphatase family protein n=1 Tax=unclassified Streptomyces TaxID=2593676 RepID=UPI002E19C081|nr:MULTISPECIES: histidine phosphatase family protein [unclassified Streptomyces]
MTRRILFVSPAMNPSLRRARFDDDTPLDDSGRNAARAAAGSLPPADSVVRSPSTRCEETAHELGIDPASSPPDVAGMAMGPWRGRTLEEVGAAEPEELARWLSDPHFAPDSGEPVASVCARVGRWLDATAADEPGSGRVIAIVEPEVVRAAVVHAMGAPHTTFWRLDVPPLTLTELSGRSGRWNVRLGRPLGPH